MKRAKNTLEEVHIHVKNELWNTAVNRLYYACYYAVTALLAKEEIATRTHSGVRQMLGLHVVKPGLIDKESSRFYTDIFDKRQASDYDDFINFSKEEVLSLIQPARKLIDEIETLLYSNQS